VTEVLTKVSGIENVELVTPSEPGDGILTLQAASREDVRAEVCRALVAADVPILGVMRQHGLEDMVLKLLGGDEASAKRRGKKRRDAQESAAQPVGESAAAERAEAARGKAGES
jgi:hypothetical protein